MCLVWWYGKINLLVLRKKVIVSRFHHGLAWRKRPVEMQKLGVCCWFLGGSFWPWNHDIPWMGGGFKYVFIFIARSFRWAFFTDCTISSMYRDIYIPTFAVNVSGNGKCIFNIPRHGASGSLRIVPWLGGGFNAFVIAFVYFHPYLGQWSNLTI